MLQSRFVPTPSSNHLHPSSTLLLPSSITTSLLGSHPGSMTTTTTTEANALPNMLAAAELANDDDDHDVDSMGDDDDDKGDGSSKRNKSRRELPGGAVSTLKAWLLSPEHFTHPYPTPQDQAMLMAKTGIDKKQLKNWFTNARRRIWKPMLKKQIEAGKLTAGVQGGMQVVTVPVTTTLGGTTTTTTTLFQGLPTAASAVVNGTGGLPATAATIDNPHSVQAMRVHYQQAIQDQQQQQQQQMQLSAELQQQQIQQQQQQPVTVSLDAFGNPIYSLPMQGPTNVDGTQPTTTIQYYTIASSDLQQQHQQQHQGQPMLLSSNATPTNDALTHLSVPTVTFTQQQHQPQHHQQSMSKADSHAVLMELFARDQDLVRQATESARLKAESKQQQQLQQQQQQSSLHPGGQQQAMSHSFQQGQQSMQSQTYASSQQTASKVSTTSSTSYVSNSLQNVPSLNSWPHFSSITSLNNLGSMPGVKSIASLSGVDLASKGSLNKMGNLAHVKSVESMMGKNDSYAFLEVFFCDRSSNNLMGMGGGSGNANNAYSVGSNQRGMKDNNEDNEIGLSLEDESPMHIVKKEYGSGISGSFASSVGGLGQPNNSIAESQNNHSSNTIPDGGGTLKRAYDDAMAARGLMSVSRSCEKLTDLVLPEKMQRTLSQEFINKSQPQQQYIPSNSSNTNSNQNQSLYTPYTSSFTATSTSDSSQYPGQQPIEPSGEANGKISEDPNGNSSNNPLNMTNTSNKVRVQVASNTLCELCHKPNIDTQLRPCGHMFHELCLKTTLLNPMFITPHKCPIDGTTIYSAVLAVPDPTAPSLR